MTAAFAVTGLCKRCPDFTLDDISLTLPLMDTGIHWATKLLLAIAATMIVCLAS